MDTKRCDRCESVIARDKHGLRHWRFDIIRSVGTREFESETVLLCSMCWDDLWEWAFETDVDRSDKADPLPIEEMAESVRRHIEELEGVLDALAEAKT